MNTSRIVSAMENIDEELIVEAGKYKTAGRKNIRLKFVAALAACVAVMSSFIIVQAENGGVSNLFAPLFGTAQTEIINNIGTPIGASVSADGYTLSADAVIGDRYNMAVVYTLRRDDGQPITEDLYFKQWETDVCSHASGGGTLTPMDSGNGQLSFIETWNSSKAMIGKYITVSFGDLTINCEGVDDPVIAAGPWQFSYTLRYQDSSIRVPAKHAKITDDEGNEYQIDKILISPIGLHIEGKISGKYWEKKETRQKIEVSVKKKDGAAEPLCNFGTGSFGYSSSGKKQAISFRYETIFEEPLRLNEIESLKIGGKEFPIK